MYQSFRAIGLGISENAWRNKKENITGKTEDLPLLRTGGLMSVPQIISYSMRVRKNKTKTKNKTTKLCASAIGLYVQMLYHHLL